MSDLTILILAGRRPGVRDPIEQALNLPHKCMAPVLGVPVIARVLQTIEAALPGASILLSIEDYAVVAREPTVARLHAAGTLRTVRSERTLLESLLAAADQSRFPLVVTTCDNALLTVEALRALVEHGRGNPDGASLVLASEKAIRAAHPEGKGRYYQFRDGGFSNCNLFWIGSRDALRAAEPFRAGGQFLKVKGRLLQAFGLVNLMLFRSRWLTVAQMLRRVSRRIGVRVEPLVLPDGRLAIDVDDPKSLRMVEEILAGDVRRAA